MKKNPMATVAIPVFNGAAKIEACLRSAMSQSLEDIEILVSDNASTDESAEIVRRLSKEDERIALLENEENRGSSFNFNRLRAAATGRYFIFLADDVRIDPSFLESCVEVMEQRPEVIGCYSAVKITSTDGEVVKELIDSYDLDIPDPIARCKTLTDNLSAGQMFYGVFRSDAVRSGYNQYRIRNPQYMFDRYLLCPLVIKGRIVQLKETLMTRSMDDWQLNRSGDDKETVYRQTHLRYEKALGIPSGRSNLPTLDSIYNVCEELFFIDLDEDQKKSLNTILFDSLVFKYRNNIEMDFKNAERKVAAWRKKKSLSSSAVTHLSEFAQSLSKAACANAESEFVLTVQLRAAKLNAKIAGILNEHFKAIAPKGFRKGGRPGIFRRLVRKARRMIGKK